jgi:hypothetical protein
VKARKVDRALRNVFCIVTLSIVIYVDNRGGSRGARIRRPPNKDYQLVFVAYNAKHAELRRKSKDWLLRNQDNVSEWNDMPIRDLLFQ